MPFEGRQLLESFGDYDDFVGLCAGCARFSKLSGTGDREGSHLSTSACNTIAHGRCPVSSALLSIPPGLPFADGIRLEITTDQKCQRLAGDRAPRSVEQHEASTPRSRLTTCSTPPSIFVLIASSSCSVVIGILAGCDILQIGGRGKA